MQRNPFTTGNSVSVNDFIGRAKEIRRIANRICSGGQSAAVIGEPRIGKTSLLRYLAAPEKRQELYGELAGNLFFQYIDAETLGNSLTQARFWQWALAPLAEKLPEMMHPSLSLAYELCVKDGFGISTLEKLLAQLSSLHLRLVLMVDEFDLLLTHPVLNETEFYGGLRSLDTRCDSMALVIASRQSVESLNNATSELSRTGSPYFNHMMPVPLGAFRDNESSLLLERGAEYFARADREYLTQIAGGHPFLLQTAASLLWEAYEDDDADEQARREITARELLENVSHSLHDTWRLWTPETRKAMTIIALDALPQIVKGKEFDIQALIASLGNYTPELTELKRRGLLAEDSQHQSGYRVQAQVLLWWLAGELIRVARSKEDDYLSQWQREQQLEGLLKGSEKKQFQKAIETISPTLKSGAAMVLEALINSAIGKVMAG